MDQDEEPDYGSLPGKQELVPFWKHVQGGSGAASCDIWIPSQQVGVKRYLSLRQKRAKDCFCGFHWSRYKTTITNLINRFYEILDGAITIDGIDIRNIQKDELRRHIALVLQDTHLFTGTVRENIRYGRLDATDEEVVLAAKTADADYFIRRLSHGYDTVLEEMAPI